jgi:hypothetical protein
MSKSVKDLMKEKSSRQKSLQFTEKAMPLFFSGLCDHFDPDHVRNRVHTGQRNSHIFR